MFELLHIISLEAIETSPVIDLDAAYQQTHLFQPLGGGGAMQEYNFDGLCFLTQPNYSKYTQLFRSGILEAVDAGAVSENENGKLALHPLKIAGLLSRSFTGYMDALKTVGVHPPFFVLLSLINLQDVSMVKCNSYGQVDLSDFVGLPRFQASPIEINEYQEGNKKAYMEALKPFFDALWNGAGHAKCDLFDQHGGWTDSPTLI